MEDDWVCEYDSTWDTESDGDDSAGENQSRRSSQDKNKSGWSLWHPTPRNVRAAKDMQNYRRGYPNLTDEECSEDKMNNLQFYLNKFPSAPDDIYIESFLKEWKTDYKRLERVHSYIQWLFPLREPGVNYMASELTKKEIEAFKNNEDAKRRLVESYELMLGFYGIQLVDRKNGEVKRADNWKERFGNLERNMHNNLRITRILKCLGELGFKHYQAPLVRFFLEETLVKKTLSSIKRSVLDYFLFAVKDKQKRQELVRFAYQNFEPKDKFVWCPRKIQKQFRKLEKGRLDAIGNGDAKEDAFARGKRKDEEEVVPQKEVELTDDVTEAPKETEKTTSKTMENGNAEVELESEMIENGNDSAADDEDDGDDDDDDEVEKSPIPDTKALIPDPDDEVDHRFSSNSDDPVPMILDDSIQTDGDADAEKPPKKKREDDHVLQSNGFAVEPADGQTEDQTGAAQTDHQMSPSGQTSEWEDSQNSPALPEEKIPRTRFSPTPDETEEDEAMSQESIPTRNGSLMSPDRAMDE
ncbi:opioid growth factor receptor isoform X2 [Cynoglossus semilaevis]|uniref:opioid growth factor receptor isoform X2 n=1 Tax=Cynoglossus semilaevis TaxID=244447 RepID=UPI00049733A5|nr:opioid growth factor receptor-like protein 1 isoform X2 [Cynoglossus semilaevis]